jgi:hypothetical protein
VQERPGHCGKKTDCSSRPAKFRAWSVETAGAFDLDCETLELRFGGIGEVRLEFAGAVEIRGC